MEQQSTAEKLPNFYDELGGGIVVRRLVDSFYDIMDREAEFRGIRELHPKNLTGSRDKLFMFLSGWLGGPSLYIEKYGHPRLRARHLPFPIGESERDQWMTCMSQALLEVGIEPPLARQLISMLHQTANHMRNREG